MAKSNRQRVDEALILVAEGFGAYAEDQLRQHWGDNWRAEVKANARTGKFADHDGDLADPDYVLWLGTSQWRPAFYKQLSEADRAALSFLRQVRIDWAHHKTSFTVDETHRVVDMAHLLLSSCGAVDQASALDETRQEVLRLKFEEQTKRAAAQAAEGLVVEGAVGGLRPWRDVIAPHQDVASGNFQLAAFAADFREVHAGTAQPEYGNPVEFFRRTYLTRGLRTLLTQTMRRLNGVGGDPVVDLMTTFGGGKTHSLLAVYHLAGHGQLDELAGMRELANDIGIESMPSGVARAVVIGNDFSPRGTVKEDGTQVNTMWGELAWQLGGRDSYERVRDADESRTNPGTTVLCDLLAEHAPCVVLIDEWIAYARQLWNRDDLPAGSLDTHMTFAQSLTEAAKSVRNCLLVVSIPSSDSVRDTGAEQHSHEIGGVGGVEALKRLRSVVHRTDSPWQPASPDESFEIVRRRVFKAIAPDDLVHRDVSCRRFAEMYAKHPSEFPSEVRRDDYETRLKAAYPIHPELFDRLYQDWSTLERFQRTRGVLRLMATAVHALWTRNDKSPLILPSSIPLEDTNVFEEITSHLDDNWQPVVDQDVAGPNSLPARIDREHTALGRAQAAQRVARTIFFGSAPTSRRADGGVSSPARGIENLRIALGSAFPGDTPALFGDALRRLTERASFLNHEGVRYWLSTQPTVTEIARSTAEGYDDSEIVDDLAAWIAEEKDRGDFARVHRLPSSSADVDDDQTVALVVLGAEHSHARKSEESPGKRAALEFTRHRGTQGRQYQNMVLILAPDANRLPDLLSAVRMQKAWQDVFDNREIHNLDQHNLRLVESNLRAGADTISGRITETYIWLLVPRQEAKGPLTIDALKLNGRGSLAARSTGKAGDDGLLITRFAPTLLRMAMDSEQAPLWRDGDHLTVAQVWGDFTRYPYLPRLRDSRVLLDAVVDGPQELNAEQDGFGYADAYDEERGRYRGLVLQKAAETAALTGLIVRYDAAKRQWDEEQEAARRAREGGDREGEETGVGAGDDCGRAGENGRATTTKATRFTAWKQLDPVRAGKEATDIADELLALFTDRRIPVKVTIEIEAEHAEGFDETTRRNVTENANTLGFGHHEFE